MQSCKMKKNHKKIKNIVLHNMRVCPPPPPYHHHHHHHHCAYVCSQCLAIICFAHSFIFSIQIVFVLVRVACTCVCVCVCMCVHVHVYMHEFMCVCVNAHVCVCVCVCVCFSFCICIEDVKLPNRHPKINQSSYVLCVKQFIYWIRNCLTFVIYFLPIIFVWGMFDLPLWVLLPKKTITESSSRHACLMNQTFQLQVP